MATQLEIIENRTSRNSQISESETKNLERILGYFGYLFK